MASSEKIMRDQQRSVPQIDFGITETYKWGDVWIIDLFCGCEAITCPAMGAYDPIQTGYCKDHLDGFCK